jgi:hypothetical protein
MKLVDFFSKYTKEEVVKHFLNYISDAKWEEHKNTFMFHYVVSKEIALPRSFINDHLHLVITTQTDPKEIEYQESRIFSSAIYNYPLGDKLISEYGDKLDWTSIGWRKDLTLEFFNQHRDKIKIKNIQADLGADFLNEHLLEMDLSYLRKMTLSLEQAERLMTDKKAHVSDFWNQAFFTKEFALERIKPLKDYVSKLNSRFNFTLAEKMQVLKVLDEANFEHDEWNGIISEFMDSKDLSLAEKKDIKWLAWI